MKVSYFSMGFYPFSLSEKEKSSEYANPKMLVFGSYIVPASFFCVSYAIH